MQHGMECTESLTRMTWFLLVQQFDITQRQTHAGHRQTNRMTQTYEYLLTPPVMCTQQLFVLH